MLSKLKEASPLILGLVLLALLVWVALPWLPYIGTDAAWIRALAVAVVLAIVLLAFAVQRWQAGRKSAQLAQAVAQQAQPAGAPSGDVVRLREKFEDAVAALQQKRKRGDSLYDLPWFVFVGPPGSGKTTALVKSGLRFPLEQRSAVKGVGGTRNCDWWFTDEAVFLDTAGRYFSQDSDATADSTAWREFLGLLRKYRKRRPINGIILTVSAPDLLTSAIREDDFDAARRRLRELNKELGIQIPVYLMVTKCDLVLGFAEFFDDLTGDPLSQVLGMTFPYEASLSGDATQMLAPEFDQLLDGLRGRVLGRLSEESDVTRRTRIFGFPLQMAVMRDPLVQFVEQVFSSTRFDQKTLLRGVYFTSGTQEGTPLDRLVGVLAKRLAVPEAAVSAGRGKAYFVGRLLRDVLLEEAGLAGTNRRVEAQKAALQLGAYVALAAVTVLGVLALWVSYEANLAYIDRVESTLSRLVPRPSAQPSAFSEVLGRLDAMREVSTVANALNASPPWRMRWGLFQGDGLGQQAADAYGRQLNGTFARQVVRRFQEKIEESAGRPELVYVYLKALLVLAHPERLGEFDNARQLQGLVNTFRDGSRDDKSLQTHLSSLLDGNALQGVALDGADDTIRRARGTLQTPNRAGILYLLLQAQNAGRPPLKFDQSLNMHRVFRQQGPLQDGVKALYTKPVFQDVVENQLDKLVKQLATEDWVFGPDGTGETRPSLPGETLRLYEADYIKEWDRVLAGVQITPMSTPADLKAGLAALSAKEASPLRQVYEIIDRNTNFSKPPEPPKKDATGTIVDKLVKRTESEPGQEPGEAVTLHFADLHRFVMNDLPLLIDKLTKLGDALAPIGTDVVNAPPSADLVAHVGEVTTSLKQDVLSLPASVRDVVISLADSAERVTRSGVAMVLHDDYQPVAKECRTLLMNRYPFAASSGIDLPLRDFSTVFRSDGQFDAFFKGKLANLVQVSGDVWRWRTDLSGAPVGGSGNQQILNQVKRAAVIRQQFFGETGQEPKLNFWVSFGSVDTAVDRVVLTIDGQSLNYDHERAKDTPMEWPGKGSSGEATVVFHLENGTTETVISHKGAWALFRLLDDATTRSSGDTVIAKVSSKKSHYADILFKPSTQRHPFGNQNALAGFGC